MINVNMKNRAILLNETKKHLEKEMEEYISDLKELYSDFLAYNGFSDKYSIKFIDNDVRLCIPHSENIWGRPTFVNSISNPSEVDNLILTEMEETLKQHNKKCYRKEKNDEQSEKE